jgi:hypothetical protein
LIVSGPHVVKWVSDKINGGDYGLCQGLGWDRNGLKAGVIYNQFNGVNCEAHIAVDHLSKEFLWAMFDYPFNQMGVKRITGCVSSANQKALRLDKHLGFEYEATLKGAMPDGDLIILVMWRDKCRFLR